MNKLNLLMITVLVMLLSSVAQSADPTPTPTGSSLRIRGDWHPTATSEPIQQPAAATPTATPGTGGPTGHVHTVGEGIPGVDATDAPNATSTATPRPGGPTGPVHTVGEGIPGVDATGDPNATPTPTSGPGDPTGPAHTVGEGLFDVDAAATALHQMIHSPDATPAFRSICDLPPRSRAEVDACDAYKAAYKLKYGNPCRHNDEGEAICLH